MKNIIFCVSLIVLHWLFSLVMPWWNLTIVAFVLAFLMRLGNLTSFWLAFLSAFTFWAGLSGFLDLQNDGLLGSKLAQMFSLNSSILVYLVSGIIGALVAAFSASAGNSLAQLLQADKKSTDLDENSINTDDLRDLRPDWKDKTHI